VRSDQDAADQPYARPQVVLHWLIATLVIVQWLSADAMGEFFDRYEDFGPPGFPEGGAIVHAAVGATILTLMILRVAARLRYGAPPLPADLPRYMALAAHLNHYGLYAVLILLPLTGVSALFVSTEAADIHELLKTLLLLLVAAHVLGAAFHAFVRRDGVVWRMLSWRRKAI
jgi:cytochrome b561